MSQTTQRITQAHTENEDIDLSYDCYTAVINAKANTRESLQLLNSVCDSLSNLCTNEDSLLALRKNIQFLDPVCGTLGNLCTILDSLDDLMESIIFCKEKGNSSPQAEPFH